MKGTSPRIASVVAAIVGISLLHYLTPLHLPQLHDIFQRLYYLPIILAAFWFGLRGGLAASILVSVLYAPHVLFQWGGASRPTLEMEKFLEIVLYNVVGGITGYLSQREEARREELVQTAQGLEESYKKLQAQADLIIRIEEQLRKAERLSVLGELSAVLAHEIRNPLGSIRGTAEILKDDYRPGDRKYEFVEIMLKETERLNGVVENFLGLARPAASEQERLDLRAELKDVVAFFHAEASSRGVGVTVEPFDLPPARGNRDRLRQAFINLLLNALQATPRGGSVTIAGSLREGRGEVPPAAVVTFSDTGTGMKPEVATRIFDPFYTTKSGGTGLGLSITQKIIESNGGTIAVQSRQGEGTVFTVTLPLA